jgi:hypothetical protein
MSLQRRFGRCENIGCEAFRYQALELWTSSNWIRYRHIQALTMIR